MLQVQIDMFGYNCPTEVQFPGKPESMKALLEDPEGPYLQGPPLLRAIATIEDGSIKISLEKLEASFPPHETSTNVCTNYFDNNQQYYTCEKCCLNSMFSTMCYCISCFEPEKHLGHATSKRTSYSSDAYCDCGRPSRIREQSMCAKHKDFRKDIQLNFDEEQKSKFIDFFTPLLCIFHYHQNQRGERDSEFQKVCSYLTKLNKNSVYYNRLTVEVLKKKSEWKKIKDEEYAPKEPKFYLISLFSEDSEGQKCLTQMVGDNVTRMDLARIEYEFIKDQNNQSALGFLSQQIFGDPSILQRFADEGKFIRDSNKYLEMSRKSQAGELLMIKYLKNIYEKDKSEYYNTLQNIFGYQPSKFKNREMNKFILQSLFQLYTPKSKKNKKEAKQKMKKSKSVKEKDNQNENKDGDQDWEDVQDAQNENEEKDEEENEGEDEGEEEENYYAENDSFLRILLSTLLNFSEGKTDKIVGLLQNSQIKGVSHDSVCNVLKKICKRSFTIVIQVERESSAQIIPILILLCEVLKEATQDMKKELLTSFWEDILGDNRNLMSSLDAVYHLITFIVNTNIELSKVTKSESKQMKNTEEEEQLFKSYLYELKNIPKEDLWIKRQNKQLDFPNAGKIIRQYCKFNHESDVFQYISTEKHENIQLKFGIRKYNEDYAAIVANKFNYHHKMKFQDPIRSSLCKTLFISRNEEKSIFFEHIKKTWENGLKEIESSSYAQESMKQYKAAFIYLFILNVVDKITNGEIKQIGQLLKLVRDNEEERFKYEYLAEPEDIKALLCLGEDDKEKQQSPEKKKEIQEEHKLKTEEKKKKYEQIKNKKYEKFNQQRGIFLKKNLSRAESLKIDEDEELCLLCHERAKIDNELVFMGEVNKDNTLSGAFYGSQNKTKSFVNICFHTVHLNCYIKMDSYECPLCSKRVNCIFPREFNPDNKKLNRICSNIIIAVMVNQYRVYDIENHFILIFKHLVESYGLNSLISLTKYETERKQRMKTDKFLLDFISSVYQHSSQDQVKIYNESIENLLKEIKACEKKIFLDIQYFFTDLIWSQIKGEDFERHLQVIKELKQLLVLEEYDIFEEQVKNIIGFEIDVDLTQEQMAINKSETQKQSLGFKINPLPANGALLALEMKNKCSTCENTYVQYNCMICKKYLCEDCQNKNSHRTAHGDFTLTLSLREGYILARRPKYDEAICLYCDDFMVQYESRSNFQDVPNEQYKLDEVSLNKILVKFLEN